MDLLMKKYTAAQQALASLAKILEQEKTLKSNPSKHEDVEKIYRDSKIKRFEYSFDTFWTYLRLYLELVCSVTLQVKGSITVFRTCAKVGLLSEQEVEQAIAMVNDRNQTSHAYHEEAAQDVADAIDNHYFFMNQVLLRVPPEKM